MYEIIRFTGSKWGCKHEVFSVCESKKEAAKMVDELNTMYACNEITEGFYFREKEEN